jgi:hypothetical protein
MSTQDTRGPQSPPTPAERLPLVFIGIVAVEILAILSLYWAGVYFAS